MKTTRRPAAWWANTRSRLQVPHTKQAALPFGKSIRPPAGPNDVVRRDDRDPPDAERRERRLDEEPEPVGHDLDRDAGGARPIGERPERRVVRLGGRLRPERAGIGA